MKSGTIVTVDWRDAMKGSGEPHKKRPGIVVTSKQYLGEAHPFEFIVPITGSARLAIDGASTRIEPTSENGCTKVCYALSWNVQSVPHARLIKTSSSVSADVVSSIRAQIHACLDD